MKYDKTVILQLNKDKPREKELIDLLNLNKERKIGNKEALMRALEFEFQFSDKINLILDKLESLNMPNFSISTGLSKELDVIKVIDDECSEDDLNGL